MSISPEQCRAARALVNWSQDSLVEASGVSKATIANFELGKSSPINATREALGRALEAAGVEFIAENGGGPGVRLRKGKKKPAKAGAAAPAEHTAHPEPAVEKNAALTQVDGVSRVRDPLKRR
ncbi:MAG: helix-turn-helix transcriptional regulator [Methylocella sp.]